MPYTKQMNEYINSHPYFFYGMVATILLIIESGLEIEIYFNPVLNSSNLLQIGTGSNLPIYFPIVAAVYDFVIIILPIRMFQDVNNSARWGYLTIIFGAGGQYLNFNLTSLAAISFLVLLLAGMAPALQKKSKFRNTPKKISKQKD